MSEEQDWQDFYDEMVELKKDNDRLTAEVEELTKQRDHWFKEGQKYAERVDKLEKLRSD